MAESVAAVLTDCPDEQTVMDLLAGRLSGAALGRVERHLGECAACMDLLAGATPLLAQVRSAPTLSGVSPVSDEDVAAARWRAPALEPGTVLRETYEIVRRTGKGAMGEVYEARHARLTGRYAVKVLPPEFAENAAVLSRFRREAQIASSLQHPNIVQVIDFHETPDGRPYLVMEYLDGEDLADVMAARGRFTLAEALPLVEQIAAALGAVHRRGIVHRDVKPHNVFVVPQDGKQLVKLVDFGLSKGDAVSPVVTRQPMLLGTPQYMAPEQAQGRLDAIGPATDQFALGALVYEMLTERPAFVGDGISSVLYQIVHEDPPPMPAEADRRAEPVLRRAMAKKSEERYPTMADFTAALAEAAGTKVARPQRHRRPILALALLAAVAALGGAAMGLLRHPIPAPTALTKQIQSTNTPSNANTSTSTSTSTPSNTPSNTETRTRTRTRTRTGSEKKVVPAEDPVPAPSEPALPEGPRLIEKL